MTNYLFNTGEESWILVHELFSRPDSVIGYSQNLSEEQAREFIKGIEQQLGYELKGKANLDSKKLSNEEMNGYYPKQAGFIDKEFWAGKPSYKQIMKLFREDKANKDMDKVS